MRNSIPSLILKKERVNVARKGHLWVFSGAVEKSENANPGEPIVVCDNNGNPLGWGIFEGGDIYVRVMEWSPIPQNINDILRKRIEDAYLLRKKMGLPSQDTNCFRLVHGEGDLLSSVIVDIYGDIGVLQIHSVGMRKYATQIAEAIMDVVGVKGVFIRKDPVEEIIGNEPRGHWHGQPSDEILCFENGIPFFIDAVFGQKTGFFIDQRNNRNLLKRYVAGKKILDLFSYTGGFSVYALRYGATHALLVDSSRRALDIAQKNFYLNQCKNFHEVNSSVKDFLRQNREKFDVIVVDPPGFAKHVSHLDKALRAYKQINKMAVEHLKEGGILATFSCSQSVDFQTFQKVVFKALARSKRQGRILHVLHQSEDHPVNVFHPETSYLKGLIIVVE